MARSGQGRRAIRTLLAALILWSLARPAVHAEARPVYVVRQWQHYLRLVPLCARPYVPLLYAEGEELTPAIEAFAGYYGGTPVLLGEAEIAALTAARWPQAPLVVIAPPEPRLALVASCIAAELEAPLYLEAPTAETLAQLQVQEVVIVGDGAAPGGMEVRRLPGASEALAYYDELTAGAEVAVLAPDGEFAFLAAAVAAHHHGALLLEPAAIRERRPRYLAWVTTPDAVTGNNVQELYGLCRYTPGSRVYDAGVGILTGLDAHDVALLIARAYSYPQLQGPWKMHLVSACAKCPSDDQGTQVGPFQERILGGDSLTGERLLAAMRDAGYVLLTAHGSPNGFALAGNEHWPQGPELDGLPPLVMAAESCLTGDLASLDPQESVALRMVAAGVAAYIGSMEVGGVGLVGERFFAFSTPRLPLGELVRLQNAARLDLDADVPRAILIGEPTLHQFEQEWVHYEVQADGRATLASLGEPFPVLVALELPGGAAPISAEAGTEDGRHVRYLRGLIHDRALSVAPALGRPVVLLEWPGGRGELVLRSRWTLPALLEATLVHALVGMQAFLVDLPTALSGSPVPAGVAGLIAVLAIAYRRRAFLEAEAWWTGLGAGVAMGGLLYAYYHLQTFPPSWPVILAIACGGAAAVWLVPRKDKDASTRWLLRVVPLFLAPFLVLWLVTVAVGTSARLHLALAMALAAIGLVYGLATLAASAAWRGTAWLVRRRRGPKGRGMPA